MIDSEELLLGSLCTFRAGTAFPERYQGKSSGDFPFIKVSDMKSPRNRYRIRGANNWVDVEEADELGAKPVPSESVVFAKIGIGLLMNRFRITSQPTLMDNNMMAAIPNEKISVDELCSIFSRIDMGTWAIGAALPYLRQSDLEKLPLDHIALERVHLAARIRRTIGLALDSNSDAVRGLESVVQSLFKSWFLDFDPVKAKAEGRILQGMRTSTAVLFSDSFENSKLGLIPSGWRVGRVSECLDILESGSRPRGGSQIVVSNGVPSIGAESIDGLGSYVQANTKWIPEDFFSSMKRGVVENGDVLIYKDGANVGRTSMFDRDYPFVRCAINEHVYRMRANHLLSQHYLYCWMSCPISRWELESRGVKAAQPGLNKKDVGDMPILIPPRSVIDSFTDTVRPLFDEIFEMAGSTQSYVDAMEYAVPQLMESRLVD